MKAIMYQAFGNADVLQMVELLKPAIQSGEVLIKIKALSINPMDWKIRKGEMKLMSGTKFPKYTGADFSGIVEEVGSSVPGFKKGDEVFGVVKNMMKEGASAEYIAIAASQIWKKPSNITFAQAASLPVVGTAALTAIEKMGRIDSTTTILVNGATGGFGMILLQLLKQKGAHVTAVTSSNGTAFAKRWGADMVIDYRTEEVLSRKETYDIVIDLSGKMGYADAKQVMKPDSKFLNPTPKPIEIPASLIQNLFTGKKHVIVLADPSTKYTNDLLYAVGQGLDIEIHKVFPFHAFKEAYRYAERGGYTGKVVIEQQ
ncbi:NADPH:quinone reductase-like Zn-dependent oxidoreductase [Dyadobacter sp. BE34]|uniref:NADPH:quinone reductase-like Zn-dependent oxidoreductase n=1 Tax=Dyadobacter fermentans TaxID=94254 RepID=A0ABU1QXY9_9BACT|nr:MULTISPECIES: NAD(P)-dependent alcohol dehydrogenase [Dyadobacter]MDR6806016.1 NADPH:quinone reductase-like Zn-dependent oxidoreductase [Dyadobacter fermentans]MDR7043757.1 NADPH:quinone reductase-like Zn-dependent oxidoreductase [Dyadobacter sp. BE242]MDR7198069.1 NADPH:quinone reductase-like Zn-dependent oxidoreductase [Dyadobacter sp. BE34]MDR7216031.1 NADPH:quinone reductase-like Zn-dependent oxidoreductase [Dyadobacter sp. BE31]MDR7264443.1 NADPH:quinone reductase-like Zn-dependent oxi